MSPAGTRLRVFLAILAGVLTLGSLGFAYVEGHTFADALYFSVVTVATVGYGDIHPITPVGKLLAVLLMVTGVGTFLGVVANATEFLVERRLERRRQERLSMVIGLFFSEIGTELLRLISRHDPDAESICDTLRVEQRWDDADFRRVVARLKKHPYRIEETNLDLGPLRDFLRRHSPLLLRLLENQNLLEHESFTDLLRGVFHLKEELLHREELTDLPATDRQHLAGDVRRVYPLLMQQWLSHLEYLRGHYPYLYSLAVRTNPFNPGGNAVVS